MAIQQPLLSSRREPKMNDSYRAITAQGGDSEEELWRNFTSGDEHAFATIYTRYFAVLYNYGCQFTSDSDLVKDVIQDLFIYLQEKRAGLGGTTSIKFYLFKAYRHRIRRYLSRQKPVGEMVELDEGRGFDIAISEESDSINGILDEEIRKKIEKGFAVLTKRQKEIILYYFYEGFSYQEITAIMGFAKVDYTRILMSRSILKLRKELGDSRGMLEVLFLVIQAGW